MVVTLSGMVTLVRLLLWNAEFPMVVTLSGMVTLVRLLSGTQSPNGRNAVWNGHAGEAVAHERRVPMVVTLSANGHAGEAVVMERRVLNGRNAVGMVTLVRLLS